MRPRPVACCPGRVVVVPRCLPRLSRLAPCLVVHVVPSRVFVFRFRRRALVPVVLPVPRGSPPRPTVIGAPRFHPASSCSGRWFGVLFWWWWSSLWSPLAVSPRRSCPMAPCFHPTSRCSRRRLRVPSWWLSWWSSLPSLVAVVVPCPVLSSLSSSFVVVPGFSSACPLASPCPPCEQGLAAAGGGAVRVVMRRRPCRVSFWACRGGPPLPSPVWLSSWPCPGPRCSARSPSSPSPSLSLSFPSPSRFVGAPHFHPTSSCSGWWFGGLFWYWPLPLPLPLSLSLPLAVPPVVSISLPPVSTPRAVARSGGRRCRSSWVWCCFGTWFPLHCCRPRALLSSPVSLSSLASFHPRSTPRAVAREAGGRWCVVGCMVEVG
jgi:hypothetical protein